MKKRITALFLAGILPSCILYSPLKDEPKLYQGAFRASDNTGIKVTFFGNTTILISDNKTHLLVDGFFSRPGALKTLFGKIASDPRIIEEQARGLEKQGIRKLDAVLVGHAHHDHALDAPFIARRMGDAFVMGTESYAMVHKGANAADSRLISVTGSRSARHFGDFTVTFVQSDHVGSHFHTQRLVEGSINEPLRTPARFWKFKCGEVYAIHIRHQCHGSLIVTTTAGAKEGQFQGLQAEVAMLGVGFLEKEPTCRQNRYWEETVKAVGAQTVIPTHWDDFAKRLSPGLKPRSRLIEDTRASIDVIKKHASCEGRRVMLMGLGDSFLLRHGVVDMQLANDCAP